MRNDKQHHSSTMTDLGGSFGNSQPITIFVLVIEWPYTIHSSGKQFVERDRCTRDDFPFGFQVKLSGLLGGHDPSHVPLEPAPVLVSTVGMLH